MRSYVMQFSKFYGFYIWDHDLGRHDLFNMVMVFYKYTNSFNKYKHFTFLYDQIFQFKVFGNVICESLKVFKTDLIIWYLLDLRTKSDLNVKINVNTRPDVNRPKTPVLKLTRWPEWTPL